MKIVYVAGPYNAPTDGKRLFNTHTAIDAGIRLYVESNNEIYPIIPHLTHWIEKRTDYLGYPERPNEFWYKFDNMIIPACDGILRLEGKSTGADAEVELGKKLGKKIYYSVEAVLSDV